MNKDSGGGSDGKISLAQAEADLANARPITEEEIRRFLA